MDALRESIGTAVSSAESDLGRQSIVELDVRDSIAPTMLTAGVRAKPSFLGRHAPPEHTIAPENLDVLLAELRNW